MLSGESFLTPNTRLGQPTASVEWRERQLQRRVVSSFNLTAISLAFALLVSVVYRGAIFPIDRTLHIRLSSPVDTVGVWFAMRVALFNDDDFVATPPGPSTAEYLLDVDARSRRFRLDVPGQARSESVESAWLTHRFLGGDTGSEILRVESTNFNEVSGHTEILLTRVERAERWSRLPAPIFATALAALIVWLSWRRLLRATPAVGAFLLIASGAISFLVVTPMMAVPDEPHHTLRAFSVAGGCFLPEVRLEPTPSAGCIVPLSIQVLSLLTLKDIVFQKYPKHVDWDTHAKAAESPIAIDRLAYAAFSDSAAYSPIIYLPAAVAARLAMWLDIPTLIAAYFCRSMMMLTSLFFAWGVIRHARAPIALTTILLLPMSLFLVGSTSPDGPVLLSVMLLLTLTGATDRDSVATGRLIAAIFALAVVVASTKPPYPLAVASVLFVPRRAFTTNRRHACFLIGTVVCCALVCLAWLRAAKGINSVAYPRVAARARELMESPGAYWDALVLTWQFQCSVIWSMMLGVLGWLDTWFPQWVYEALTLVLVFAFLADARRGDWLRRSLLVGAAVCMGLAMTMALYVAWTPPGATMIEGLQGRYFLVPVTLLAFAVRGWRIDRRPFYTLAAYCCTTVIAFSLAAYSVHNLWGRYYG